jgi:hypothetical protein
MMQFEKIEKIDFNVVYSNLYIKAKRDEISGIDRNRRCKQIIWKR